MARRSTIAKLVATIGTLPITLVLVIFAVSNRHMVEVQFWPLPGGVNLPLYIIGFVTMVLGFLMGGLMAWMGAVESRLRARAAERNVRALETKLSKARDQAWKARAMLPPAVIPTE